PLWVDGVMLDRVNQSLRPARKNIRCLSGNSQFRPRNIHHSLGSSARNVQKATQCAIELVFFAAPKVGSDNGCRPLWKHLVAGRVYTSSYTFIKYRFIFYAMHSYAPVGPTLHTGYSQKTTIVQFFGFDVSETGLCL